MGGNNQEYVEACIDIPTESKAFGNDERLLMSNSNAKPNQSIMVSYKSTENPYRPKPSYFKVLPNKSKTAQPGEHGQSCNDFCDQWGMQIFVLLFCALTIGSFICECARHLPPYSIEIFGNYRVPMMTKEYGIEFYVISSYKFDEKYPAGTQTRIEIEKSIVKDYLKFTSDYCKYEQRRKSQRPDIPTLVCDKLQRLGIQKS